MIKTVIRSVILLCLIFISGCISMDQSGQTVSESAHRVIPSSHTELADEPDANAGELFLSNQELTITFEPESFGRISSLKYNPGNIDVITPFSFTKNYRSPLYSTISDNSGGIRELIWGVPNTISGKMPMKMIHKDKNSICFYTKYYANTDFELTRKVSLIENTSIIQVDLTWKNLSNSEQNHALWLNFVEKEEGVQILLPVAGGTETRQAPTFITLPENAFFYGPIAPFGNSFLPAYSWAGAVFPKDKIVFICKFKPEDIGKNGFLYAWQGQNLNQDGKIIHTKTFEPIFDTKIVKPGESITENYQLFVFSGLDDMCAFANDYGVDSKVYENHIEIILSAAKTMGTQTAFLTLKSKTRQLNTAIMDIPKLTAGQVAKLIFPLPQLNKDEYKISLTINGIETELLGKKVQ